MRATEQHTSNRGQSITSAPVTDNHLTRVSHRASHIRTPDHVSPCADRAGSGTGGERAAEPVCVVSGLCPGFRSGIFQIFRIKNPMGWPAGRRMSAAGPTAQGSAVRAGGCEPVSRPLSFMTTVVIAPAQPTITSTKARKVNCRPPGPIKIPARPCPCRAACLRIDSSPLSGARRIRPRRAAPAGWE